MEWIYFVLNVFILSKDEVGVASPVASDLERYEIDKAGRSIYSLQEVTCARITADEFLGSCYSGLELWVKSWKLWGVTGRKSGNDESSDIVGVYSVANRQCLIEYQEIMVNKNYRQW